MEWLRKVVLDPRTERFIMAVIIGVWPPAGTV